MGTDPVLNNYLNDGDTIYYANTDLFVNLYWKMPQFVLKNERIMKLDQPQ